MLRLFASELSCFDQVCGGASDAWIGSGAQKATMKYISSFVIRISLCVLRRPFGKLRTSVAAKQLEVKDYGWGCLQAGYA